MEIRESDPEIVNWWPAGKRGWQDGLESICISDCRRSGHGMSCGVGCAAGMAGVAGRDGGGDRSPSSGPRSSQLHLRCVDGRRSTAWPISVACPAPSSGPAYFSARLRPRMTACMHTLLAGVRLSSFHCSGRRQWPAIKISPMFIDKINGKRQSFIIIVCHNSLEVSLESVIIH